MKGSAILFVTGRLAEPSLREVVTKIAEQIGFRFEIVVPGIQVAALLHTKLLLNRLTVGEQIDRVILPGWIQGDLIELEQRFGRPFERGPKDLQDLPEYFGLGKRKAVSLDCYSVEIIAEINHAPKLSIAEVVSTARQLKASGADVIDVGGIPGESNSRISEIVKVLREEGLRVSIDSFDRSEVEQAVRSGAELILSCNSSNIQWVTEFGIEVVCIPDTPRDTESLNRLIAQLIEQQTPFRVDPILEPIGMGFTASLERYLNVRRIYPDIPMMMGIGNVTELTEVDSAGVNTLLMAVCEELGIQSILTTQVINWCRSSVAELNIARRLVHQALTARTIPKNMTSDLVMLRDSRLKPTSAASLRQLAARLTDPNFRIYAEEGELHLMNRDGHWQGLCAFDLIANALQAASSRSSVKPSASASTDHSEISADHAFYLGYELARAEIALHLGKQYTQDQPLNWGLLGPIGLSKNVSHQVDQISNDHARNSTEDSSSEISSPNYQPGESGSDS